MRKLQLVALLIMAATFTLTACGQKGALYLPADETVQTADATTADKGAKKEKSQGPSD